MSIDAFEWEDPPPSRRGQKYTNDDRRVIAMKQNPKRWMMWKRAASADGVSQLKKTHEGFQFVSRNLRIEKNRRVADIYARFVGDSNAD